MLTTDCAGVTGSSRLVVADPSVTFAQWPSAPRLGFTERVGNADQCCDDTCFLCDYYFHYLKASPCVRRVCHSGVA